MEGPIWFGPIKYTRRVVFWLKDKKFRCDIPKEAREVLGFQRITADSLKELEQKYDKAAQDYDSKIVKRRKVIVYSLDAKMVEENLNFGGGTPLDQGAGLTVFARVMEELTYERRDRDKRYETVKSSLPEAMCYHWGEPHIVDVNNEMKVIDWTPEREEFFRQLGEALCELIRRCHKALSDDKKLIKAIDKRILKLPFNGKA